MIQNYKVDKLYYQSFKQMSQERVYDYIKSYANKSSIQKQKIASIYDSYKPEEDSHLDQNSFLNTNITFLIRIFVEISHQGNTKSGWKDYFLWNLRSCIALKKQKTILFHFKAVKLFSQVAKQDLQLMIQVLKHNYSQVSNACEAVFSFQPQDYFIIYNITQMSKKKFRFIEKVIIMACYYFSTFTLKCDEIFNYFAKYCQYFKLKIIYLASLQGYLKYLCSQQKPFPTYNVNKMIQSMIEMYAQQEPEQSCLLRISNIYFFLNKLFQNQKQIYFDKLFQHKDQIIAYTTQLLVFTEKIDKQDKKKLGRSLIMGFMLTRKQEQYMSLANPVEVKITRDTSILQWLKYLSSLHFHILKLNSGMQVQLMDKFFQISCQNITTISKNERANEYQGVIGLIFFDMWNTKLQTFTNDLNRSILFFLDKLSIKQGKIYTKWLSYFEFMILLYQYFNLKYYANIYNTLLQIKCHCLIINHVIKNNNSTKTELISYISNQYIHIEPSLRSQPFQLLNILCKMSFQEQFQEICFECISIIIKKMKWKLSSDMPDNFINIFCAIENKKRKNIQQPYSRHKISIYPSYIVCIFYRFYLERVKKIMISEQAQIQLWLGSFEFALNTFCLFFDQIQEDYLEQMIKETVLICSEPRFMKAIMSIIKKAIYRIIRIQNFLESTSTQCYFENTLSLYRRLNRQFQLTISQKINLVDFCFNVKSDIYIMLNRIKTVDNNFDIQRRFIQTISDQIDEIQMQILKKPSHKYIEELSNKVQSRQIQNLQQILSISIKNIYYVMYQGKFHSTKFENVNYQRLSTQDSNKKCSNINVQDELQEAANKLYEIKHKCLQLYPIFQSKINESEILVTIGQVNIYDMKIKSSRHVLAQINDLMYISHLAGVKNLENLLINIRLSLIYDNLSKELFLLELAKYAKLQIYSKQQQPQIMKYIQSELQSITQKSSYISFIKLLVLEQLSPDMKIFTNRIFKIIYLINQNGFVFINNIKEIISFITYLIFSFPHASGTIEEEQIILRTNKNGENAFQKEEDYWIKNSWEDGWIPIKLMVLFINKIFKTVLDLNQTSKIRSFLKFSLIFLIRTGHLNELTQPLKFALNKKHPLNLLQIIDSIKKIQLSEVNISQYKQIDKIIFNKRKSISMPIDQTTNDKLKRIERLYQKINNSFIKCGKTGLLLAEIFCLLVAQQLNVNPYVIFMNKLKMKIFKNRISEYEQKFANQFKPTSLSLQQQLKSNLILSSKLILQIFNSYSRALIVKQYISEFVNMALDDDNIQIITPQQHSNLDSIIILIALSFQEFNYIIKRYLQKNSSVSIQDMTLIEINKKIAQMMQQFEKVKSQSLKVLNKLPKSLSQARYPLSLIYPLGNYLYTISFNKTILVTFTNIYEFQDKYQQFYSIIKSNEQLLKNKTLDSNFAKRRLGLDRQLGKITGNIDIGIIDVEYDSFPKDQIGYLIKIDKNLVKFIGNSPENIKKHLILYLKRYKIQDCEQLIQKVIILNKKIRNKFNQQNILLFIHEKYLQFPFQLIKSIKLNKGIYRIPSAKYLLQNQNKKMEFRIKNCKFLVNTKQDLPNTQSRFQKIRSNFNHWMGIKGRIPQYEQVKILLNQEVFLYMGHGTGIEGLSDQQINYLRPQCLMMIFGCESAKMIFDHSEPCGTAFRLLSTGCPAYLGCLWTVTDLDIDKITQEIFLLSTTENLSQILEISKKKCHYPHINGSSTVIYGLPTYLKR